ncbi:TetR/AcrR family transcriptional regulator [Candidatus Latescibacterota bacterium]
MTATTIENTSRIIEAVVSCAAKLFRRYGYKKTTVDDIASGVRISKKTLYSVFPSKEEILRETVWRETVEVIRAFNETVPTGSHPDIVLLSLCRYIFTDRIKKGKIGSFWNLYVDDDDIYLATLGSLKRIIRAIYDDGRKNGIFKPVDSNLATEIIISMLTVPIRDFHLYENPLRMFNDSLKMIADAVSYKDRIKVEAFV